MKIKLSMLLLVVIVSGCTVLYSEPSTWTASNGKLYQFSAEYEMGTTGRRINIYCNGEKVMVGKAHYWSKRLTMTTVIDNMQTAAACGGEGGAKVCNITMSGETVAKLKF